MWSRHSASTPIYGKNMDYKRIRSTGLGQRLAFEELICQLARREQPSVDAEFRRIEGAGGDGGIEAYWLLSDGGEIGYQAKYYTKSADINWSNIDDSVRRALETHPGLSKYIVALPCDLTDKTGKQNGGNTGWENWQARKKKWASLVAPHKNVDFIAWTASEITDRLAHPNAEGLRRYWFGDVEFSPKWFSDHIELAVKSLDERYHPEDHVEVSIERVFKVLLRDESIIGEIQSHFSKIQNAVQLAGIEQSLEGCLALIEAIQTHSAVLDKLSLDFTSDAWGTWPIAAVLEVIESISTCVHDIERVLWQAKQEKAKQSKSGSSSLDDVERRLRDLSDASYVFESLLKGRYFSAESGRSVFISGKAGAGKSHLLGSVAQSAISERRVVVLILGQQLNGDSVWAQISKRLGIGEVDPDVLLQALSAAADVTGKRGLILVDAVNEGAGLALWRNELAEFVARVERHPNLILAFSCRAEYIPYIIPLAVSEKVSEFRVRGFETQEEQSRAARIYLGKRGISQPNTPWLAAEFVNPLFLRSACVTLERENQKWFPKGLIGTKRVFSFYTRSIARNLGAGRDGSDDLVTPTNQALAAIASDMAANRRDYVPHSDAIRIVDRSFHAYPAPQGKTWFEILQKNGLFRLDPDPRKRGADPFSAPEEIARFSFQRLQDHLMASVILETVTNPSDALKSGTLKFIHDDDSIHGDWVGLVDALSVQLPERFNQELLDLLPGNINTWVNDPAVSDGFIDSLRWRDNESFTDRTLQIFNAFLKVEDGYFDIIIQVGASAGHPWNAEALHKRLIALDMPKRDAYWTVHANILPLDEGATARRLIEWSALEQSEQTDPEVQYLCAITLTWFLASSNRELRDKATKALTSLMIRNPSLYAKLCGDFAEVDDLYILERLHMAAFGACCVSNCERLLRPFSEVAYKAVFDRVDVPASILLRDAALGIIELAACKNCLLESVDIQKARPPYDSKVIRLFVTEEAVEKAAKRAGDSQILNSCAQWGGDFGSYEIRPRVTSFLNISLSTPEPLSPSERYEIFEQEVIDHCPERVELLEMMHAFTPNRFRDILQARRDTAPSDHSQSFKTCETLLLGMLSTGERARYRKEYRPRFSSPEEQPDQLSHIDVAAAQRWVAKRAYSLGWTKDLFPDDWSRRHDYSRDRPLVERIGKKYQWLALDELLCSLADNKWMSERALHGSRQYRGPLDVGFHRDIDPTILMTSDEALSLEDSIPRFEIIMRKTEEQELGKWPFEEDPALGMAHFVSRTDAKGRAWIVLHEHQSKSERYKDKSSREHGLRKQEWRFLLPIIVKREDERRLIKYISMEKEVRVDNWSTRDATDDGYLLEAPWRSTWDQEQWSTMDFRNIGEVEIAYPCFRYQWESHLDASLSDGAHALIPAPWLAKRLGLTPHHSKSNIYADSSGKVLFVSGKSPGGGSHAFIDRGLFDSFLQEDGLVCVWVFVTERGAWPGGGNSHVSWRRSEGVIWFSEREPQLQHWKEDVDKGEPSDSVC